MIILDLIDDYLKSLPIERDVVSAKEVRDLLLDIRLTFMVHGEAAAPPESKIFRFGPMQQHGPDTELPPYDGGPAL